MAYQRLRLKYLVLEEIDYEMRIRGVTSSKKNVVEKRNMLSRLIESVPDDKILDAEFDFEEEKNKIISAMSILKNLIEEFDAGTRTDTQFKRIDTRLFHYTARTRRMIVENNDQIKQEFKNETVAELISLEAAIYNKTSDNPQRVLTSTPTNNTSLNMTTYNPPNNFYKPFPIYKLNVTFDGQNTSVTNFLQKINELSESRGISKNDLFKSAIELFSGDAIFWYRSVKNSVNDWDSLAELLKKDYLPINYDDRLLDQIKTRKQGRNEKVGVFIAVMLSLFDKLSKPLSLEDQLKYIKCNLQPYYVRQLSIVEIKSISELADYCRKIDEAYFFTKNQNSSNKNIPEPELAYVEKTNFSKPSASESSCSRCQHCFQVSKVNNDFSYNSKNVSKKTNSENKILTCWNCKKSHHYRDCKAPKVKFCYGCGLHNYTKTTCPKCSKN